MMPYLGGVADGQRLGMKMKLRAIGRLPPRQNWLQAGQLMGICWFVGVRAGIGMTRALCA
jgi:hypothetical protein